MKLDIYLSDMGPGSASKLAKKLGVPAPLLSQWRTGCRVVPACRCPDIERETGGIVRCEDLRPDVDWGYVRASRGGKKR